MCWVSKQAEKKKKKSFANESDNIAGSFINHVISNMYDYNQTRWYYLIRTNCLRDK